MSERKLSEEKQLEFLDGEFKAIDFNEYEDYEFAIARMGFLSTRPNSHKLAISEEVFRECAPSVLGSFLVVKMKWGDATTHANGQNIVGYVPKEQDVEYVYDEEGYLRGYVSVVISKMYAQDFCDIFESDNERAVSVEMRVRAYEPDENGYEEVLEFNIYGVTTLGKGVAPSSPGANIELVRFSDEEANTFYSDYKFAKMAETNEEKESAVIGKLENMQEKQELNEEKEEKLDMDNEKKVELAMVDIGDIWRVVYDKLVEKYPAQEWGSVYSIYGIFEEDNKKFAIIYKKGETTLYRVGFDLTEEGLFMHETMLKVAIEFTDEGEEKEFSEDEADEEMAKCSEGEEEMAKCAEDEELAKCSEDEELAKEGEVECAEEVALVDKEDWDKEEEKIERDQQKPSEAKIDELLADKEAVIMAQETELSELRAYKLSVEDSKKVATVEAELADVKEFLSDEQFAELREAGLSCDSETITAWSNTVKAVAFEQSRNAKRSSAKMSTNDLWRIAAPVVETNKPKDIWD